MGISASQLEDSSINLHGVTGKFDLVSKNIQVHFFSTAASARGKKGNGKYALLEQLKPMRERVEPSEIRDLHSLLQRDLNDRRVAEELIPYVLGEMSDVVFFPAVLAVLIPENFITSTSDGKYPKYPTRKKINENGEEIEYEFGDYWNLTQYKLEKKKSDQKEESELAMLKINANTDIIVLDGQHRANAFRVVSDTFEKGNDIHSAFYTNENIDKSAKFNADLPVTIIWFEYAPSALDDDESPKIEPTLVSRKLFVDVNNTAKSVSKSRTILLNDYKIRSLLTRFLYSGIADKHGFETNNFSLLHTAFDIDTDLKHGTTSNCFVLTTPEIIHDLLSWFCLGPRAYRSPQYKTENYEIARYFFSNDWSQASAIFSFFENGDGEEKQNAISDIKNLSAFEEEFKKILFEPIYKLFNELKLFRSHYDACEHIKTWVEEGSTITEQIWEHVFCGGEGLYYTFRSIKDKKSDKRIKNYLKGIDEIEKEFKGRRAKLFRESASNIDEKEVNSIFKSISTKAFQVGLIMAFDFFINNDTSSLGSKMGEFVEKLNDIELNTWANVFIKLKNEIVSGIDPKQWPVYQKIIIWLIQPEYYNDKAYIISPEGQLYRKKMEEELISYIKSEVLQRQREFPSSDDILTNNDVNVKIKQLSEKAHSEVKDIIKYCNQKPIAVENEELIEISHTIVKESKNIKNIWDE